MSKWERLRPGTIVKLREDLVDLRRYDGKMYRQEEMARPGDWVTISGFGAFRGDYYCKETTYIYTVEMFQEIVFEPLYTKGEWEREKRVIAKTEKKPSDNNTYVGIELEFISNVSRNALAKMLADNDLHEYVEIDSDGSVRGDFDHPYEHELKILAELNEFSSIVKKVLRTIKTAKCKVNSSCGFHVHLDMRNRKADKALQNLSKYQRLLFSLTNKNRQKASWCKAIYTDDLSKTTGDKYTAINASCLSSLQTIEIRIHAGSLDERKIIPWVKLLNAVVDAPKSLRKPFTKKVACEDLQLDSDVVNYIYKRHEALNRFFDVA